VDLEAWVEGDSEEEKGLVDTPVPQPASTVRGLAGADFSRTGWRRVEETGPSLRTRNPPLLARPLFGWETLIACPLVLPFFPLPGHRPSDLIRHWRVRVDRD